MQRARHFSGIGLLDDHEPVVERHHEALADLAGELALGPLHRHRASGYFDLHALRNGDGFSTDSRHRYLTRSRPPVRRPIRVAMLPARSECRPAWTGWPSP